MAARKVILYISCSLDGFIAKPDDDLSFLDVVRQEGEDYGYQAFVDSIDTVILGRRTYMWVKEHAGVFPHEDKETYVVTRKQTSSEGNVHYWAGSLRALVDQLKQKEGKNIYCDGGAAVVNEMLRKYCFDELVISIIPIILGDGIKLFHDGVPEVQLQLIASKSYPSGLVQVHYGLKKSLDPH